MLSLIPYSPKGYGWRSVAVFLSIIVIVLSLYAGWKKYEAKQGAADVAKLAEALREAEETQHNLMLQDTYGGKTPQETLALYIEAVEEGDYDLAAKYFVLEEQERELQSLRNSPKENIDNVNNLLKQSLKSEGSYSQDKKTYGVRRPLYVGFVLYPNGIWKISEI